MPTIATDGIVLIHIINTKSILKRLDSVIYSLSSDLVKQIEFVSNVAAFIDREMFFHCFKTEKRIRIESKNI